MIHQNNDAIFKTDLKKKFNFDVPSEGSIPNHMTKF